MEASSSNGKLKLILGIHRPKCVLLYGLCILHAQLAKKNATFLRLAGEQLIIQVFLRFLHRVEYQFSILLFHKDRYT